MARAKKPRPENAAELTVDERKMLRVVRKLLAQVQDLSESMRKAKQQIARISAPRKPH